LSERGSVAARLAKLAVIPKQMTAITNATTAPMV